MTRTDAARLLGVPVDASPDEVRHAWRMWARVAHPDLGGDSRHFAALDRARRVLLTTPSSVPVPTTAHAERTDHPSPAPAPVRPPLTAVLRRPNHAGAVAVAAVLVILSAAIPAALGVAPGTVDFAMAAVPAALGAAAWSWWTADAALLPAADRGHRISALALAWLAIALAQQVVSALAGASLLAVLPMLALPLAGAVGVINLGAGLWRPIQAPRR